MHIDNNFATNITLNITTTKNCNSQIRVIMIIKDCTTIQIQCHIAADIGRYRLVAVYIGVVSQSSRSPEDIVVATAFDGKGDITRDIGLVAAAVEAGDFTHTACNGGVE